MELLDCLGNKLALLFYSFIFFRLNLRRSIGLIKLIYSVCFYSDFLTGQCGWGLYFFHDGNDLKFCL